MYEAIWLIYANWGIFKKSNKILLFSVAFMGKSKDKGA